MSDFLQIMSNIDFYIINKSKIEEHNRRRENNWKTSLNKSLLDYSETFLNDFIQQLKIVSKLKT